MTLREQLQDFVVAEIGSLGGSSHGLVLAVGSLPGEIYGEQRYCGKYATYEKGKDEQSAHAAGASSCQRTYSECERENRG